jgi:hypothetical protein
MKNQNKPAFSVALKDNGNALHKDAMGLTKREYFAGLAMQGLLSNPNGGMTEGSGRTFSPDGISDLALKHADALLERLSNENI